MLAMYWTHVFAFSMHSKLISWLGLKGTSKSGEEMGKLHWVKSFVDVLYQLTTSYRLTPMYGSIDLIDHHLRDIKFHPLFNDWTYAKKSSTKNDVVSYFYSYDGIYFYEMPRIYAYSVWVSFDVA